MSYEILLKRIYSPSEADDGARILVDRLWPRGKPRDSLELTDWYRDASPSTLLRRQLHQDEISQSVFAVRYRGELHDHPENLTPLMRYARRGRLTLLSASRNLDQSHLPVLRQAVLEALQQEDQEDLEPASPPCFAHQFNKE